MSMSMKTQKCLSPTKENLSPTKQKHSDPLAELLAFVKAAGLTIPSQLQKHFSSDKGSILKVQPTEAQSSDSIKKLKVKLGDTQFQLKKLEEDFAEYKHQVRIERDKEIKRYEESYNLLKSTLEETCEDSTIKLAQLKESTTQQMIALQEKHKRELKQEREKLIEGYQQKLSSLKKVKERQINELVESNRLKVEQLIEKYEGELLKEKQLYEQEMKKQALKHKEALDIKENQFQSIYTALQSEKKTEEKLHEKTKLENSQAKEKLYSELYYERNVKKHLEETLAAREKETKELKSKINDLLIEIQVEKDKGANKQKEISRDFEKKLSEIEEHNKQELVRVKSAQEKDLRQFEDRIQQLNEWKQQHDEVLKENYTEIEKKFDERPSRREDLDMIDKLKARLQRKEEEVRLLNKELRNCALEIENKEETYNKIFTSSTMNKLEKKSLTRDREDFKSRDSLCRKSQTTDIKFLLKVYNKHI